MSSSLETFAGLLDRSVQEIGSLAADARTVDLSRIGRIADIWDNNTFPLVRVAYAPRSVRAERGQAGLLWMAGLGAARRQLLVDLDPALDAMLPAARLESAAYRDYRDEVCPGSLPVTAHIVADLEADYDLSAATLRSIEIRSAAIGLCASLTLVAPRRFTPSAERVRDGASESWPPAPLIFTFTDVSEVTFDADDRAGAAITSTADGVSLKVGGGGHLRAASATVRPDDPYWHESAAGRAADAVTPHERETRREPVPESPLTGPEQFAAEALLLVMRRIRMVGYYPRLASRIPVPELCDATADAGTAILKAGARRGLIRRFAFASLAERWQRLPPDTPLAPTPAGSAALRYVRYTEPHRDHGTDRSGQVVLAAATPDTDPAAPWRLASEEITKPTRFRITDAAFNDISDFNAMTGHSYAVGDFAEYWASRDVEEFALEAARPSWPRVHDVTRDELVEVTQRILADPAGPDFPYYLLVLKANVPHPAVAGLIFWPKGGGEPTAGEIVDEALSYQPIALCPRDCWTTGKEL